MGCYICMVLRSTMKEAGDMVQGVSTNRYWLFVIKAFVYEAEFALPTAFGYNLRIACLYPTQVQYAYFVAPVHTVTSERLDQSAFTLLDLSNNFFTRSPIRIGLDAFLSLGVFVFFQSPVC